MTPRNYQVYRGYIRNYICPDPAWHARQHATPHHQFQFFDKGIGHLKLSRLTVGAVTKFRDDLRTSGLSVATTRKIIAMLQVMLGYGIALDLIAFNAALNVEVIGRREDDAKRIVPPSKDVLRQLIELADARFGVKLLFAAATGVRAGELHALRWRHLSFERREVRIETRVDPYGNEEVPKTKAGIRTLPLGESVLSELHRWRGETNFPGKDDLVFPNRFGKYYNHTDMVKRKFLPLFAKLEKKWKEERRNEPLEVFNWHALRHFAISCWIQAGLPPKPCRPSRVTAACRSRWIATDICSVRMIMAGSWMRSRRPLPVRSRPPTRRGVRTRIAGAFLIKRVRRVNQGSEAA